MYLVTLVSTMIAMAVLQCASRTVRSSARQLYRRGIPTTPAQNDTRLSNRRGTPELRRRLPSVRHEVVADAGHAVQNDKPVELARLVDDFLG